MARAVAELRAGERIRVISEPQFRDPNRGMFPVGIEPTTQTHLGYPVYKDNSGQRYVLKP